MTLVYSLEALRWDDFRATKEGRRLFPEGVTTLCLLLAMGFLPILENDPRNQQQVDWHSHNPQCS